MTTKRKLNPKIAQMNKWRKALKSRGVDVPKSLSYAQLRAMAAANGIAEGKSPAAKASASKKRAPRRRSASSPGESKKAPRKRSRKPQTSTQSRKRSTSKRKTSKSSEPVDLSWNWGDFP